MTEWFTKIMSYLQTAQMYKLSQFLVTRLNQI